MDVKIIKKPLGIPTVTIACSHSEVAGANHVIAHLTTYGPHMVGEGLGRIRMSPTEARALATALVRAADTAESGV